jgi:peptidyl-prolyl cis-trans isomerase D
MLRGLRKASANWLGKTIMALVVSLLVVAFGVWGIGDIFRGFGLSTVAKVGGTEITVDQFRNIYNDRLQQISRRFNRAITSDQARALGFDRQLLAELMQDAALDDRARRMRLGISDAELGRRIQEDPAFRGTDGQFDPQRFSQTIATLGYNEQRFVTQKRRDTLRNQLTASVNGGIGTPKVASDAINRFQNEERTIDFVKLDRSKAGNIPQPTAEELAKYFNDHKLQFRAPEYRKIVVLSVTPEEMARTVEVSDADAQKAYDAKRERYTTPEKRAVQQIVFPNAEDARKAADRISASTSFDAVATERGLKVQDLGLVAKTGILDPDVAAAAFALKQGQVSAPVQGHFGAGLQSGTALLKVTKIEPEKVRAFSELKAEMKQELALTRVRADIADIHDKVEDERAAGSRLDEVAQKLKLPVRTLAAVDRSGRAPDGKSIAEFPGAQEVLNGAFASDINVENEPVQVTGGGLVWYEVAGIERSHDRILEDVKDRVTTSWRDNEVTERVATKANEIADKLKSGSSFKDVAAANGLKIETAKGLRRRGSEALPAGVIEAVFRTSKDGVGTSAGKDPTERFVFRVTAIGVPAYDPASPDAKRISDTLRNAIADELLGQYVLRVEADLGATINGAALKQAIGASGNE